MLLDDDEKGRMALMVFQHHGIQAAEELKYGNFITMCAERGWRTSDIADGIDFGVGKRWFERLPNGFVRLTEAGYRVGTGSHQ